MGGPTGTTVSSEAGGELGCHLDKPRTYGVLSGRSWEGSCGLPVCVQGRDPGSLPYGRSPLNSNSQVQSGYFLSIESLRCFI